MASSPTSHGAGWRAALSSTRAPGFSRLVELLAFALAVPLIGRMLFPGDPLGLAAGFPWIVIGPVVFAARYGSANGLACVGVAVLALLALASAYADQSSALVTLAIGSIVLTVVVGDAAGGWRRRGLRAEAENEYLHHRLKEFSNDYHVLKVSHGQLEEFLAGQRLSLRQALHEIEPALTSGGDALGSGAELMAVFAQFCSIQVAGLYAMRNDSLVDEKPLAVHGDMGDLPRFDPLLRLAITERKLVSVKLESAASNQHDSGLLAVVPIADSRGQLYGLLAIRDMHFMAFQQENLNILALLAGYIGDRIARAGGFGDTPANRFVAELDTALRFAQSHAVRSSLLILKLGPHEKSTVVAEFLASTTRSLDSVWIPPVTGARAGTTVVLLLPLVEERGCRAWVTRVKTAVEAKFGLDLTPLIVAEQVHLIDAAMTRGDCLALIRSVSMADTKNLPATAERIDRAA